MVHDINTDGRKMQIMIQVNKSEMKKLRQRFPGIHATRTVHKYYIEERPEIVAFLKNGCGEKVIRHA